MKACISRSPGDIDTGDNIFHQQRRELAKKRKKRSQCLTSQIDAVVRDIVHEFGHANKMRLKSIVATRFLHDNSKNWIIYLSPRNSLYYKESTRKNASIFRQNTECQLWLLHLLSPLCINIIRCFSL